MDSLFSMCWIQKAKLHKYNFNLIKMTHFENLDSPSVSFTGTEFNDA
jgi:hypothetical protein